MGKGLTLKVEGCPGTMAQLARVKSLVNSEAIQDVLILPARLLRDVAKRLVNRSSKAKPHGYEHLRDAIFAAKGKRSVPGTTIERLASALHEYEYGPSVIVGVDRKKAPHAHLVEYGHGGPHPAPAHPYMRPAASSTRPLVVQMIADGVRRLLLPFSK